MYRDKWQNVTWESVTFVGFCYECSDKIVLEEGDIKSKEFIHLARDWEVDFPSIVFVYLPDDGKALYNQVKVMSNHFGGIQTQCAVQKKYDMQRQKEQ